MRTVKLLNFWLLLALGMITVAFNSYGQEEKNNNSSTTDVGVVINGVKWATRNVDAFGTFAATPESPSMFYQWNRKTAWSATDSLTAWDSSIPTGDTWESSNDPSPEGWRVPTFEEQRTLFDTEKVANEWTTQNGVTGRKFTDKASGNSLFLPAVGSRGDGNGMSSGAGTHGLYWSGTQHNSRRAESLYFESGSVGGKNGGHSRRSVGLSVRCVAYGQSANNNSSTTDVGVVINGVKWATRNVDAFGTFAATPESPGMFYQWNRKIAWTAAGSGGGWDSSLATCDTWESSNDPSPEGWRVPTVEEQQTLLDTKKVANEWTTQNGVTGRKFTDKASGNSLFLPAAGCRRYSDGMLSDVGTDGGYWSSTRHDSFRVKGLSFGIDWSRTQRNCYRAYSFTFGSGYAGWGYSSSNVGLSVRSVAK